MAAGCDKNPAAPEYQKEVTVFGFLWGNEYLTADHAMMLSYSQPITAYYDFNQAAIRGAEVSLTEIGSGVSHFLMESPEKPGFYFNDLVFIKPKTSYTLRISVDGREVTATTTVPPQLELQTELDTVNVNQVNHTNLSKSIPIFLDCESPEQVILVDMYCNESYETAEYVTEFFGQSQPGSVEEYESGQNGEPRHIMGFGKYETFTSANFPNRYVVDWYSSMIVFFGSYTLQVMAIDKNYQTYLTTQEYREFESGIEGGIGLLGSVTGKTFKLQVVKR
jgi:hypothetical protein